MYPELEFPLDQSTVQIPPSPALTAAAVTDSKKPITSERIIVFLISIKRISINSSFYSIVCTVHISSLLKSEVY
jgi:hypothetical protein